MKITRLETLRIAEFPKLWDIFGKACKLPVCQMLDGESEGPYEDLDAFLPSGPGFGCELLPEVWKRKDATVRVSPA